MKYLLQNMDFFSYHGVYPKEKLEGNRFSVDVEFEADASKAATTDSIEDAINYENIYGIVKKQMAIRSDLLENIVERIFDDIKTSFSQIVSLTIRVSKHNPPFEGKVEKVTVEKSF